MNGGPYRYKRSGQKEHGEVRYMFHVFAVFNIDTVKYLSCHAVSDFT